MTRHTRNRQLQKLNSALAFNTTGCNIPIELSKKHVCYTDLDPTFKWKRVPMWGDGMPDILFNYITFKSRRPRIRVMPVKEYK